MKRPTKPLATKGMVLCAGLGTRLLPITESCPKPLASVLNLPNLLHNVFLLKEAGIEDIILNLHHLGEQIEAVLGNGDRLGLRVHYSYEPVLLGTGGGVAKAASFFDRGTFVLMNCDFVTNIDIAPIIEKHQRNHHLATMVLLEDAQRGRAYSQVGTNALGELCSLPRLRTAEPTRSGIFTGIHILEPETLQVLKPEPSGINEVLYPHYMKSAPHRIFGEYVAGYYWHDTGNIPLLWSTSMALLDELARHPKGLLARCLAEYGDIVEIQPGLWGKRGTKLPSHVNFVPPVIIGADCQIADKVAIGPRAIIGDESQIESSSYITRSVLIGRARVKHNEQLERVIRYGEAVLPLSE